VFSDLIWTLPGSSSRSGPIFAFPLAFIAFFFIWNVTRTWATKLTYSNYAYTSIYLFLFQYFQSIYFRFAKFCDNFCSISRNSQVIFCDEISDIVKFRFHPPYDKDFREFEFEIIHCFRKSARTPNMPEPFLGHLKIRIFNLPKGNLISCTVQYVHSWRISTKKYIEREIWLCMINKSLTGGVPSVKRKKLRRKKPWFVYRSKNRQTL
jgi:hypothetical protein